MAVTHWQSRGKEANPPATIRCFSHLYLLVADCSLASGSAGTGFMTNRAQPLNGRSAQTEWIHCIYCDMTQTILLETCVAQLELPRFLICFHSNLTYRGSTSSVVCETSDRSFDLRKCAPSSHQKFSTMACVWPFCLIGWMTKWNSHAH